MSTKLHIPLARPGLVSRPRLIERLNASPRSGKLALISAPAGFGKTTLLEDWILGIGYWGRDNTETGQYPIPLRSASGTISNIQYLKFAWLSVDEGDNDVARFFSYFVAALQTVYPEVGKSLVAALQSPQAIPAQALLTTLINEIAALPEPLVLVLDDYHLIEAQAVHDGMAFLLDHLPPKLHLVIATRADPPLPLALLRGQGQLTEVRAADLRFTLEEIGAFFELAMGVSLPPGAIETLEARIEGWALGVQLASLAARGREDVEGFVRAFAGEHRYVIDYLTAEVFDGQPEDVKAFLLQTSILERLSAPLCDAVRGAEEGNGQAMLERLVRRNLFTIQLDEVRGWFRYHHLFADFMRARLRREASQQMPELHRRASQWLLEHQFFADAVRHAFAIPDLEMAGSIIRLAANEVYARGEWHTLQRWLEALPDDVKYELPELAIWYALILLLTSQAQAAEPYLRGARPRLDESARKGVINPKDHQACSILIDIGLAEVAQARGDAQRAFRFAKQAQEKLPPYRHTMHTVVAQTLSDCYLHHNDTPEATRILRQVVESNQAADNPFVRLNAISQVGRLQVLQGQLAQAASQYRRGLHDAHVQGMEFLGASLLVGLGDILREQDQLEQATRLVQKGIRLAESGHRPGAVRNGILILARLRQAQRDRAGARERLAQAQELAERASSPHHLGHVLAHRARFAAMTGDLATATRWAQTCGLDVEDDVNYAREEHHVILARVLLALQRPQLARHFLARLRKLAEAGARTGRVIEILILQALVYRAIGDLPAALMVLRRALVLAEPQGYARVFLDEGPPIIRLLQALARESATPSYASKLLSGSEADQPLIEPLSEREKEILQLIAAGLSNRAIAGALFISFNTVIWHNKNIYRKLGVKSRTQAVARARELALIVDGDG